MRRKARSRRPVAGARLCADVVRVRRRAAARRQPFCRSRALSLGAHLSATPCGDSVLRCYGSLRCQNRRCRRSSICCWSARAAIRRPSTIDDLPALRRLAVSGTRIGGVSGGPFILAKARVMDGIQMTIHWQHAPALVEAHPDILLTRSLFIIDRNRLTCAGGTAPLDMMHALIAERHGAELARKVSDWFLHTEIRPAKGAQRASLVERYGVHHAPGCRTRTDGTASG